MLNEPLLRKHTYHQEKDNKLLMNRDNYKNIVMEHQKIPNLSDNNLSNHLSKFRTKNWVEINDESK